MKMNCKMYFSFQGSRLLVRGLDNQGQSDIYTYNSINNRKISYFDKAQKATFCTGLFFSHSFS